MICTTKYRFLPAEPNDLQILLSQSAKKPWHFSNTTDTYRLFFFFPRQCESFKGASNSISTDMDIDTDTDTDIDTDTNTATNTDTDTQTQHTQTDRQTNRRLRPLPIMSRLPEIIIGHFGNPALGLPTRIFAV